MTKSEALEYFGGPKKVADVLNINPASVSQWGEIIPPLRAYQLREIKATQQSTDDQLFQKAS